MSRYQMKAGRGRVTIMLAFALVAWMAAPSAAVRDRDAGRGTTVRETLTVPHPGQPATMAGKPDGAGTAGESRWHEFVSSTGHDWEAVFNPVTGAPHRAWGNGIAETPGPVASATDAEGRARAFITAHASLLACDPASLELVKSTDRGGRYVLVFQQVLNGVPVEGGRVDVRLATDGRVSLFGSDFFPDVNLSTSPRLSAFEAVARVRSAIGFDPTRDEERSVELRILPMERDGRMDYRLAWRMVHFIRSEPVLWVTWLDADSGETLWRYDDLKYDTMAGTVDANVQIVLPSDPYTLRNLKDITVTVTGQGADTTDAAGAWSLTVLPGSYLVGAELRGRFLNVNNQAGADAAFSDTLPSGTPVPIHWNDANSQADERDAYYHAIVAHDSIKTWDPSLTEVDYSMPCAVSINDACNAFWDGNGINFFHASAPCVNTGQMPDVVYHEYGHGITQFTYAPGDCPGDQHEGFSDYYAATITDQPVIGRGFFGVGTSLRTIDNDLVFPDSMNGEAHHDGLIVAGGLWDMRARLITTLGSHTAGAHLADSLFHYARYGMGTSFLDYFLDLAAEDDNDGDLANGTPHGIDIYQAFGQHGIGPGLYVAIAHDSLKDRESTFAPIPIQAAITSVLPLDTDSLRVFYRTRPVASGTWSALTSLLLTPTVTPHVYSATIPGQPDSTLVEYYLSAKSDTLGVKTYLPASAPAIPYVFAVGPDRTPPSIVHTPLVNLSPADWPPTVTAVVTDNSAVASVVVQYLKNGVAQPSLTMTAAGPPDTWSATFPPGAVAGDIYDYKIVATDASAAANTADYPHGARFRVYVGALLTLFTDTIESGAPGWTHYVGATGFVDQWHVSTNRNHTPGGSKSWKFGATGIFGRYANSACGALQSPAVVLGDHSKLSFWHWIRAEEQDDNGAWDGGILEITRDGGASWQELIPSIGGYTHTILSNPDSPFFPGGMPCWSGTFDWRQVVVDLAGITGTVSFRWRFGSDGGTTDLGWHVDDVQVTAVSTPTDVAGGTSQPLTLSYALGSNRPNPFVGRTAVQFAIPVAGRVSLAVYDVNGRLVRMLMDGEVGLGEHSLTWDGRDASGAPVAAGVYFYRMDAGEFTATRKMTLTR